MTTIREGIIAVSPKLYKRAKYQGGLRIQNLAELYRMAGEKVSTKTIAKQLRNAGVMRPWKVKNGRWAKRWGHAVGAHWKNEDDRQSLTATMTLLFRKNRPLDRVRLGQILRAIAAWASYANAGLGEFDADKASEGEKPP